MDRVKKPKPCGVCNVCRTVTDQLAYLNHRCTRTVYGRRCYGIFRSGLGEVWEECKTCRATGQVGIRTCSDCSGLGWHLLR
jgi:hypothetical protein